MTETNVQRVTRIARNIPADPASESRHLIAWRLAHTQRLAEPLSRAVAEFHGDKLPADDAVVRDLVTEVFVRVCSPHLALGPSAGDVLKVVEKLSTDGDLDEQSAAAIREKYMPPKEADPDAVTPKEEPAEPVVR